MSVMFGLTAGIAAAGCTSATDVGTKFSSEKLTTLFIFATVWSVSAVVLSLACIVWYPRLITHPIDTLPALVTADFWLVLAASGILNAIAYFFYTRAFRHGDASLVVPLTFLTPVLLLVTSPVMLGERIPPAGIIGVLGTVWGAYFLGRDTAASDGWVSWCKGLCRHRGTGSMLITACAWSVTSNLDKMGMTMTTPLLWSACISIAIAVLGIACRLVMRTRAAEGAHAWRALIPGTANAMQIVLVMYAMTALLVPYAIAIKRLSAVFTVVLGGALFGEKTKDRLVGSSIMIGSTILMALGR